MLNSDDELIHRARNGDTAAFSALAERYRSDLLCFFRRFTRQTDNAQDLVQETLLRAFLHLDRLRDGSKFGPWLRRIALNAALLSKRSAGQLTLEPFQDEQTLPPVSFEPSERFRQAVRDALIGLDRNLRTVIQLHYLEGYDYGEIGLLLDLPVSTVRGRLYQARRHLREELCPMSNPTTPPHVSREFALSTADLAALRGAASLAGLNSLRPVLESICLDPDGTVTAADDCRVFRRAGTSIRPTERILVHRSLLDRLSLYPNATDGTLKLEGKEAVLRFSLSHGREQTRSAPITKDIGFPNVKNILPEKVEIVAGISVRDLLGALEEVARFESFLDSTLPLETAREGRRIHLIFREPDSTLTLQDLAFKEGPGTVQWTITAQLPAALSGLPKGEPFMIALDRFYLLESLKALGLSGQQRVEFYLTKPLAPLQIQPEGETDRIVLLMPMDPSIGRDPSN